MANDIIVQIKLDDGSYKEGIISAEQLAKKSGQKIGNNLADGTEQGFKSAFGGVKAQLLGLAAGIVTAAGIKSFFSKAIEEASGAESALNKLNLALSNAGTFSKQASLDFQDFAKTIQATTAFSDDQVLGLASLARNFARTNEEAKKLTQAALDLSAATGIDVDTAVKQLGGTLSGSVGLLGKTVAGVKGLTEEQLKLGQALDIVSAKFGGSAAQTVNTFAGRTSQLKNAFNDVFEEIGKVITQSPTILRLIEGLGIAFGKAADAVAGIKGDVFKDVISGLFNFSQAVTTYVIAPLELTANIASLTFSAIKTGIQTIIVAMFAVNEAVGNYLVAPFLNAASKIGGIVGLFNEEVGNKITQGLQGTAANIATGSTALRDSAVGVLDQFSTETQAKQANLFNFSYSEQLSTRLGELQTFVDGAKVVTDQFTVNSNNATEKIKGTFVDLSKTFQTGIVQSLTQGVSAMTGALVRGQNGFEAFGKTVLGIIGDMAIQIGSTILAIGLGIDALKASLTVLSGGLAIAAGFALIALGGALKALGGGGGIGGAAGGGVAGGGVAAPVTGDAVTTVPETEPEKQGTKVSVNVQGNILDRRETGLELARIINESFDSNGTVLASGAIS